MSLGRSERLVGRERELTAFREWLAQAGGGAGGVYAIAGEPGVGKSRLAAEAISALPVAWLAVRGRAADRDRPGPFRAVAEAMLAASRNGALPADPDVHAFAAVLGHLVPAWRQDGGADEPVVVVAEAMLRVLRALAAPAPAVLLIEDAQWADPETLAVLEYFADNVAGQPLAVVVTVRSDTPSPGLSAVRDLAARRVATLAELARLGSADVTAMACECLGTAEVGADVRVPGPRGGIAVPDRGTGGDGRPGSDLGQPTGPLGPSRRYSRGDPGQLPGFSQPTPRRPAL
jgi:hypothetical protein